MSKRACRRTTALLVTLLLPLADGAATANERPPSHVDVSADLRLRRELGFRADEPYVHGLHDRRRQGGEVHDGVIGIPLSQGEHAELLVRDEMGRLDAAATRELFRTRDDFGGVYIDNAAGGRLHVLTTSDPGTIEAALRPRLRHPDRLVVRRVTRSYASLESAHDEVRAHVDALVARGVPVSAVEIDERANTVNVALVEDTAAHRQAVLDATRPGLPLTFVERARLMLAGGNVPDSLPFRGGQSIRSGSTPLPKYDCSLGFVGYQNTSSTTRASAVITAGHCGFSGQPWYQYDEYIGLSTTNTWPSNGGSTIADAMRIPITYGMSNDVLAANGTVLNISGWEGQYDGAVGQTVCNNGASSYRVCGILQNNNVTALAIDKNTGAIVEMRYMRRTSTPVKLGDSGGPVTHTAGAVYASGIVHGGVPVEGSETEVKDMHYAHIYNALRALQLHGVYTS